MQSIDDVGGENCRQFKRDEPPAASLANHAQTVPQALLSDAQARHLLNVGETTFLELIDQPWMPRPIQLGPRLRRWSRDELLAAIATKAPRAGKCEEPAQLRRRRIESLKTRGVPT